MEHHRPLPEYEEILSGQKFQRCSPVFSISLPISFQLSGRFRQPAELPHSRLPASCLRVSGILCRTPTSRFLLPHPGKQDAPSPHFITCQRESSCWQRRSHRQNALIPPANRATSGHDAPADADSSSPGPVVTSQTIFFFHLDAGHNSLDLPSQTHIP